MPVRVSTDSAPTLVDTTPHAGFGPKPSSLAGAPPPPAPSFSNPASPPSVGDPAVDTKSLYAASPALTFPTNALYAVAQFSLALLLLPYHFILYALVPSKRGRPTWTWTEAALMPAVKRIMSTMDRCGYKIGARNTARGPGGGAVGRWWLRVRYGVEFEWVEGLPQDLRGGVLEDQDVQVKEKVGVYSWRREGSEVGQGLVGLWLHGGAYTHNSAHPAASSSSIPRTLFKREPRFSSIHAVEYRLLPDSPFPAALQDAAAAYVSLLRREGIRGSQVVLMGDSSGGHLALALTRWVKETRRDRLGREQELGWSLEEPAALILFSPWTDPSHSYLGHTASTYVPRKNSSDYIFEEPEFRLHLVTSLLGPSRPASWVLSPYMAPGARSAPPGALAGFPPCFVHYGTSDRCEEEGARLVDHLTRDGVRVERVVTEDTPHDVLLLAMIWKKQQVEQVWNGVLRFVGSIGR